MSESDPADPRLLAGEYVLGVLSAEEMRDVRARARSDADLAAEIRAWEAQLVPMVAAVPPRAPPDALWDRLDQAIAPLTPDASNDDVPVPVPMRQRRRGSALGWQVATGVSLALAAGFAALAFLPVLQPGGAGPPPEFAAIVPIGAPATAFVATVAGNGNVVLTSVSPAPVPPGRDLELWILHPGAAKVAPLGVLPAGGGSVHLPAEPATGTQLLISLEPAGGSTTGQPTGPVLYGGTLTNS